MRYPLRRRFERLASDRWARRALRILLRSAWLGLSIVCIGLGLQLLLGLSIPLEYLGVAALVCVALGALLLLRRRLNAQEVARRLDTRFDLNDQLSTALEVSTQNDAEGVALRLLDQAQATTIQVQRQIAERRRHPWPELLAVMALLLVGGGLLLLMGLGPPASTPAAEPLPPLAESPQANQQNPEQEQQQQSQSEQAQSQSTEENSQTFTGEMSGYDQQSAEALADALRDQSATRPAADELDQGNIDGAAQELRELADQAEQLSGETRRDLADELRSAASQIEPSRPDMADQLRESAYGLQQAGPSSAEALENLANTVEQLEQGGMQEEQAQGQQQGQQGQQGQGSGGSAGDASPPPGEQREQSHERLGVDGVPLELESDGEGNTPGEGEPDTTSAGGGAFTSGQEAVDETMVQVGEDPLSIPADLRDVVQEYFSAPETE
jgi:hypothetical protein